MAGPSPGRLHTSRHRTEHGGFLIAQGDFRGQERRANWSIGDSADSHCSRNSTTANTSAVTTNRPFSPLRLLRHCLQACRRSKTSRHSGRPTRLALLAFSYALLLLQLLLMPLLRFLLLPFRAPLVLLLFAVATVMGNHWTVFQQQLLQSNGLDAPVFWTVEVLQALVVVVCTMPDLLLRQISMLMARVGCSAWW